RCLGDNREHTPGLAICQARSPISRCRICNEWLLSTDFRDVVAWSNVETQIGLISVIFGVFWLLSGNYESRSDLLGGIEWLPRRDGETRKPSGTLVRSAASRRLSEEDLCGYLRRLAGVQSNGGSGREAQGVLDYLAHLIAESRACQGNERGTGQHEQGRGFPERNRQ